MLSNLEIQLLNSLAETTGKKRNSKKKKVAIVLLKILNPVRVLSFNVFFAKHQDRLWPSKSVNWKIFLKGKMQSYGSQSTKGGKNKVENCPPSW